MSRTHAHEEPFRLSPKDAAALGLPADDALIRYVPSSLPQAVWDRHAPAIWQMVAETYRTSVADAKKLLSALVTFLNSVGVTVEHGSIRALLTDRRIAAACATRAANGCGPRTISNYRALLNRLAQGDSTLKAGAPSTWGSSKPPYAGADLLSIQRILADPTVDEQIRTVLHRGLHLGVIELDSPAEKAAWKAARNLAQETGQLSLTAHRLQRTWLVDVLTSGVPVHDLLSGHGVARRRLISTLCHLPTPAPRENDVLRRVLAAPDCGTHRTAPLTKEPTAPVTAISNAEARRRRKALLSATTPSLPEGLASALHAYTARHVDAATWKAIRPLVVEVMERSHIRGVHSFDAHLSAMASYVAWAKRQDVTVAISKVMRHALIEEFIRTEMADNAKNTQGTTRSRLLSLASHVNPGPDAPPPAPKLAHVVVRPPYTAAEVAAIVRVARTQPVETVRRQLSAMTGLGLGAGLDAKDFNQLRVRDIRAIDAGWQVTARGRTVPIRNDYTDLVQEAIAGRRPSDWVIGTKSGRRHAAHKVVEQAVMAPTAPEIVQARLRTTWLAACMTSPVPLHVLLAAAGLSSARTLTELTAMLPAPSTTGDELREV